MSDFRQKVVRLSGSIGAMPLDEDRCYRAVAGRDARFDGQFVTAVRSTGIYCRPSCPAVTPRRANVEFWPTPAAAQQRGFRACLRCRPDAVPGSPDWNVRADLAGRAMRLIADGVVERDGVPGLATRLGYSERQLGRVLRAELGAGPLALARAHRAHTARQLIETTSMPITDVAFAAGFASVRQFNDTVLAVYGVPPTRLRANASGRQPAGQAGTVVLRLPFRVPFDGAGLWAFLGARAVPGVESVADASYRRTLRLPHGAATAALDLPASNHDQRHVVATLRLEDPRDLAPAVARLRRLLDLDADPVAIDTVLGADPLLAGRVAASAGIRLPGAADPAETALRAVLGQQVSVAAARTAAARLAAALGDRLSPALAAGGPDLTFPSAAAVAEHGAAVLTGPTRRTAAVVGLAAALAAGLALDPGRDPESLRAELMAVPGIGPWTAGYVAMRVLGDPDQLLPGDLAVRRGARALGIPNLVRHAARWSPWRSYAALHLWRASTPVRRSA